MCKFFGKILMLTVAALLLSAGISLATPSSDWNDSWGFPTPAEKANLLNQALAIEFVEDGGFSSTYYGTDNSTYYSTQNCNVDGGCFNGGDNIAIGSQVNVDVDGDNNTVSGNDATTDGNTAAQTNDGDGSIDQNNGTNNGYPF